MKHFDFLYRIGEGYATLRRYAPELLNVLGLHAAPAAKSVLDAIELIREMNAGNARKLPDDAPVEFIRERWAKLIFTEAGPDRRYYELCALAELKNAFPGCRVWSCAAAFMPVSTKVRRATPSREPCSSAASERSGTGASSSNATAQVALLSSPPPSRFGTPFTSKEQSRP